MNSIAIEVSKRNAAVTHQDAPIVAGNVGFDVLTATFDAEWDGLDIVAVFAGRCRTIAVPYADGMAVPWEAIAEAGHLRVTLVGYSDGIEVLRTCVMEPLPIEQCCPREGVPDTPATRDIVGLAMDAADTALAAAGTAEAAADRLDEMEGAAHSLPEGSAPTASIDRTSEPWKLDIGIPAAVGGQVNDVKVNGQSVVDSDGIAALEVDEELSELSANPVANAAVSQHFMNAAVNADETLVFWRGLVTV